jgi:hypothetical protein
MCVSVLISDEPRSSTKSVKFNIKKNSQAYETEVQHTIINSWSTHLNILKNPQV